MKAGGVVKACVPDIAAKAGDAPFVNFAAVLGDLRSPLESPCGAIVINISTEGSIA